jgi:hypothetical protein
MIIPGNGALRGGGRGGNVCEGADSRLERADSTVREGHEFVRGSSTSRARGAALKRADSRLEGADSRLERADSTLDVFGPDSGEGLGQSHQHMIKRILYACID